MTLEACVAAFENARPLTIGVEEELMLVDPDTLDLAPRIDEALGPGVAFLQKPFPLAALQSKAAELLTAAQPV